MLIQVQFSRGQQCCVISPNACYVDICYSTQTDNHGKFVSRVSVGFFGSLNLVGHANVDKFDRLREV